MRSVFETFWEIIPREILEKRVRDVGKQEGNVVGQVFREDGG